MSCVLPGRSRSDSIASSDLIVGSGIASWFEATRLSILNVRYAGPIDANVKLDARRTMYQCSMLEHAERRRDERAHRHAAHDI
jgi:hypothetical protein